MLSKKDCKSIEKTTKLVCEIEITGPIILISQFWVCIVVM